MTNLNASGKTQRPPRVQASRLPKEESPPLNDFNVAPPCAQPTPAPSRPSARGAMQYPKPVLYVLAAVCLVMAVGLRTAGCQVLGPLSPFVCGVEDVDAPPVFIAVMGATGSGKTTFINLLSGSNLRVGEGLRSCTDKVQAADEFRVDGRRVILIDTPGSDDTSLSDADVLKEIAAYLEASYEQGIELAGVLYFHRISDPKMTGISRRNFSLFRKLCGDGALKNVVIVTNRWGEVDPKIGMAREAELMRESDFFKPVLDKGARMARHQNTLSSAQEIIRMILKNHPLPLLIQEELVTEHKDISETSAAKELNKEINARIAEYERKITEFMEEVQQAVKSKDEEARKELEFEAQKLGAKVEKLQGERDRMAEDYQRLIEELRAAAERERARMIEQIRELQDTVEQLRRGSFPRVITTVIGRLFAKVGAIFTYYA